jgi:cell wall-associated NlpC family hydrolase
MEKKLPRDASQQALFGEKITSPAQAQCGDLAFFQNKDGRITHTGLILDSQTIIHASGKVRVDAWDEQGIFCLERNEYSHELHSIRCYCISSCRSCSSRPDN